MSAPGNSAFKVGLVQMRSGLEPAANLAAARDLIEQAARAGADYVLTPEMTNIMEVKRERLFAAIAEEERDPTLAAMRETARKQSIYLHIGSLAIKVSHDKAANRSFLIDRRGDIVARYDKIHMFDVDLANGESYRESSNFRPGELAVLADMPWGRLGMTVCYDLRFPALYRALAEAGASFLAIPAAFTKQTGEAHWHVLMRARAIENGCFVFAAAQGGTHENGRATFGHSLVVDPWGQVIAEAGNEPGLVLADVDPAAVAAARARIPSLLHGRRFEVIEPMAEPTHLRAVRGGAMIRYTLNCDKGHTFESWFANSAAYDKQAKRSLIACPVCNSAKVEKAIMAPRLSRSEAADESPAPTPAPAAPPAPPSPIAMMSPVERELRTKLKELREHIVKNADYVGPRFPEQARKIHYGEVEHRSIYGEATPEEAEELHDEGIAFAPLPVLPDEFN